MTFFITPLEVASMAVLTSAAALIVGILNWRTARHSVDRTIYGQKELLKMQRNNALLDKATDAYIQIIGVLLNQPPAPESGPDHVEQYQTDLEIWDAQMEQASAPFYAYVPRRRFDELQALRVELKTIQEKYSMEVRALSILRRQAVDDPVPYDSYSNQFTTMANHLTYTVAQTSVELRTTAHRLREELRSDLRKADVLQEIK